MAMRIAGIRASSDLMHTPTRKRCKKLERVWQAAKRQLSREEVPEYLREAYGPFITGNFRGELSLDATCLTIFTLHNETANIWSHLLGFLLMVGLLVQFVLTPAPLMSSCGNAGCAAVRWPLVLFVCGALYVLGVSTLVHLMCCMGRRVYTRMWKYDYTAISVVMWTMYVPWCWYIFDCQPARVKLIYVAVSGCLATMCVVIGLSDRFQAPTYHALQPVCFCLLGLVGLAPMIHGCVLFWGTAPPVRAAFGLTMLQLVCNAVGAALFSTRVPERFFPGRLNVCGHSHFLMHLLVICSFVAYYYACLLLWHWRSQIGGCTYACAR